MRFLTGEAAAVIGSTLLIADAHLGMEFAFRLRGLFVPLQATRVAKRLAKLAEKHGCGELVVIGDCKHDVYGFGFELQEKKMMRKFLEELRENGFSRVLVVKGNHDSQLNELAEEMKPFFEVVPAKGFVLNGGGEPDSKQGGKIKSYGVFHGHAWPSDDVLQADVLLCAHLHPFVEIADAAGSWRVPVWLIGKVKASKEFGTQSPARDCIVFPAFSPLAGGTVVNREKGIGPLFENKLFDLPNAAAFQLNGSCLGKIGKLAKLAGKGRRGRRDFGLSPRERRKAERKRVGGLPVWLKRNDRRI